MGQISEAEISMVLDTYMYLNYQQAAEGDHISHILTEMEKLPDYQPGGRNYGEYTIIKQAAENEQIGNLTISCQSAAMGYDPALFLRRIKARSMWCTGEPVTGNGRITELA